MDVVELVHVLVLLTVPRHVDFLFFGGGVVVAVFERAEGTVGVKGAAGGV